MVFSLSASIAALSDEQRSVAERRLAELQAAMPVRFDVRDDSVLAFEWATKKFDLNVKDIADEMVYGWLKDVTSMNRDQVLKDFPRQAGPTVREHCPASHLTELWSSYYGQGDFTAASYICRNARGIQDKKDWLSKWQFYSRIVMVPYQILKLLEIFTLKMLPRHVDVLFITVSIGTGPVEQESLALDDNICTIHSVLSAEFLQIIKSGNLRMAFLFLVAASMHVSSLEALQNTDIITLQNVLKQPGLAKGVQGEVFYRMRKLSEKLQSNDVVGKPVDEDFVRITLKHYSDGSRAAGNIRQLLGDVKTMRQQFDSIVEYALSIVEQCPMIDGGWEVPAPTLKDPCEPALPALQIILDFIPAVPRHSTTPGRLPPATASSLHDL